MAAHFSSVESPVTSRVSSVRILLLIWALIRFIPYPRRRETGFLLIQQTNSFMASSATRHVTVVMIVVRQIWHRVRYLRSAALSTQTRMILRSPFGVSASSLFNLVAYLVTAISVPGLTAIPQSAPTLRDG